jgi:hypothetical protein
MTEARRAKIADLPANPAASAIYRRDGGEIFIRLNKRFHVPGYEKGGRWIGNGMAEEIDLTEIVEVLVG